MFIVFIFSNVSNSPSSIKFSICLGLYIGSAFYSVCKVAAALLKNGEKLSNFLDRDYELVALFVVCVGGSYTSEVDTKFYKFLL